jgi:hypothetical protein
MTDAVAPAAPERDSDSALARLVDVLLDKGVYLDLDLVITVAEVPLIAVNLRATIAGVETMLAYGVPGLWSPDEGEGAARPRAELPPVEEGEAERIPARLREDRATGPVWRSGHLRVARSGLVRWYGSGERRPALRLEPGEVLEVDADPDELVVRLRTSSGAHRLALDDPEAVERVRGAVVP